MTEETIAIDYVMEAASGAHFSGLRLDGLLSVTSSPRASGPVTPTLFSSPITDSTVQKQPFVLGVSGGTASGKTTVCDMIIQQLHDHRVVLVNQDSFYRGLTPEELKHVHENNFDHPDAFGTEQLLECVEELKCGKSVRVPIYDFKTHQRSSESFRQRDIFRETISARLSWEDRKLWIKMVQGYNHDIDQGLVDVIKRTVGDLIQMGKELEWCSCTDQEKSSCKCVVPRFPATFGYVSTYTCIEQLGSGLVVSWNEIGSISKEHDNLNSYN